METDQTPHSLTPFVAGILAWVVPGAGHVYLGRTLRGVILCICINGLFWSGVAFGGVFTVQPQKERWWFMAQILTGISAGASWFRQKNAHLDVLRKADQLKAEEAAEGNTIGIGEAEERVLVRDRLSLSYPADVVSRAYTGIAGMLNLMCIFDAFMLAAMGRLGEPSAERKRKGSPPRGKKERAA